MKDKLSLFVFPVAILLIIILMYAGYKLSIAYKGPEYCLAGIEDENPALLNNLAEINTLNTRLMEQHWISAVVMRNQEDDKEVTISCHFYQESHRYDWSEMLNGDEIENIKLNTISIVNPKSW